MIGGEFLKQVYFLILSGDRNGVQKLLSNNRSLYIDKHDFEEFIFSFSSLHNELKGCINLNGSGGSRIPKLNISSIACLYIAAITGLNIVKTGSSSNSSLFGSSDLFNELGLLHLKSKSSSLSLFHFAYYDYLQLSPWKLYRNILITNTSLKTFIENGIFFDYSAQYYFMGIALNHYYDRLNSGMRYNDPDSLITYYTNTKYGIIDEIIQGDVYVDDKYLLTIDGDMYIPRDKSN